MNPDTLRIPALLVALGTLAVSPASAALLSYEGFSYTSPGSVTGQTGGTGWRSPTNPAWNGATSGTIAASGLSYTAVNPSYTTFAPAGLAASYSGALRNDRFLAMDAGGPYDVAGLRGTGNFLGGSTVVGTLWCSFLVGATVWDTGSGPQMIFNLSSGNGTGTQASIRQTGAGTAISLTNTGGAGIGATGSIPTASLSTTNPNLIVFRYVFNGAGSDTFDVWLNPTAASNTPNITATNADYILNSAELRSVNANGNLVFDEVRFGTTFADVVPIPEPSTSTLIAGLALLGLVGSHRRRNESIPAQIPVPRGYRP